MNDNKMHLGFSPLTNRVYLGKQNKDQWVGDKRDVTSEFLQVMLQMFPIGDHTISSNGKTVYKLKIEKAGDE